MASAPSMAKMQRRRRWKGCGSSSGPGSTNGGPSSVQRPLKGTAYTAPLPLYLLVSLQLCSLHSLRCIVRCMVHHPWVRVLRMRQWAATGDDFTHPFSPPSASGEFNIFEEGSGASNGSTSASCSMFITAVLLLGIAAWVFARDRVEALMYSVTGRVH